MLDFYVESKISDLLWEDVDALIQLRNYSKSSEREPDVRARNQLIRRGLLNKDGKFSPEILSSVRRALNKEIVFDI